MRSVSRIASHCKTRKYVKKEDQILKFDIKEDKDKLQAINLKKI